MHFTNVYVVVAQLVRSKYLLVFYNVVAMLLQCI